MTQPDLFHPLPEPRIADTSRESFERIKPTRELMYRRIVAALDVLGEATAAEIAKHIGVDVLSTRPRCSEMDDMGWIEKRPSRKCRVRGVSAHPYRAVVTSEAVAREKAKGGEKVGGNRAKLKADEKGFCEPISP